MIVPWRLGGVKIEPDRYFLNSCNAYSWASGVIFVRSASVIARRTRGGGLMGSSCEGEVSSPGTSERGVAISFTGKIGLPVSRSSTKTSPIFVSWTTASREVAPFRRVTRIGAGGLSGAPLMEKSTRVLARVRQHVGAGYPLIGVGGVFTRDDVRAKLAAGADLVQLYTGFVYGGPLVARRLAR